MTDKQRRDPYGRQDDGLSETLRTLTGQHKAAIEEAQPKRARAWDAENPAFRFRIREQDAQRLTARAAELRLSLDALTRALVWAALDALDQGRLALDIDQEVTETADKRGRYRTHVKRLARPVWAAEQTPNSDDCSEPVTVR